eukprot:CAMPEP_0204640238 /NCGR_PEP_ID=MMETSP0717-20131115/46311_1 /ASSEMBLY_ACC=CAM_ASM_000666 /TAXON_ID=230516 /ORGANISM="Chaetoceros curvisetus" /LENGTH=94 /DNA_ID=CAMNT_0051660579 /DNA_START=22 /DNA_END=306 /DNA_ORIENTATION=-
MAEGSITVPAIIISSSRISLWGSTKGGNAVMTSPLALSTVETSTLGRSSLVAAPVGTGGLVLEAPTTTAFVNSPMPSTSSNTGSVPVLISSVED